MTSNVYHAAEGLSELNYYKLVKGIISIYSELILCGAKMLYFIMYEAGWGGEARKETSFKMGGR